MELEETEGLFKKANAAIEELEKFYTTVVKEWGKPSQRTIGHIRSSPAIALNVAPGGFAEDWGAFELDESKFAKAFKGDFLDLGAF